MFGQKQGACVGCQGFQGCTGPRGCYGAAGEQGAPGPDSFAVLVAYRLDDGNVKFLQQGKVWINAPNRSVLETFWSDSTASECVRYHWKTPDFDATNAALLKTHCGFEFDQCPETPCPPPSMKSNFSNPRDPWYFDRQKNLKYVFFFSNLVRLAREKCREYNSCEEKSNDALMKQTMCAVEELRAARESAKFLPQEFFNSEIERLREKLQLYTARVPEFERARVEFDAKERAYVDFLNVFSQTVIDYVTKENAGKRVAAENICVFYC